MISLYGFPNEFHAAPAREAMADLDDTTEMLRGWTRGDASAGEALFARLYDEIRGLASRRRAGKGGTARWRPPPLASEARAAVLAAWPPNHFWIGELDRF